MRELPDSLSNATSMHVELVATQFEAAWRRAPNPNIDRFLDVDALDYFDKLIRLIAVDLRYRLAHHQQARVEEYVVRYPRLKDDTARLKQLVEAEQQARSRHGEIPELSEYEQRFPGLMEEATLLAGPDGQPISRSPTEANPHSGSKLGDFQVIRLLGEGSRAKVYLARDETLGRIVAVKASSHFGSEGKTLARLEHPNIVSVYRQQVVGELELLAMRYVPGRTAQQLVSLHAAQGLWRWRGADLLEWLRSSKEEAIPQPTEADPRLPKLRYARLICHLMLDVARAISHAHSQGVLHRDVKPANILIGTDGIALLTDFNVAAQLDRNSDAPPSLLGGTLGYMSPEHLLAFKTQSGPEMAKVDHRSDIFSLGVAFYELLYGTSPWQNLNDIDRLLKERLQLPYIAPRELKGVTPGMASILRCCLAPDPTERYQSAAEVVSDLERLLDNRPLAFAPDPSSLERFTKWSRRSPRTLAAIFTLVMVGMLFVALKSWHDYSRLQHAEQLLNDLEAHQTESLDEPGQRRQWAKQLVEAREYLSRNRFDFAQMWSARYPSLIVRLNTLLAAALPDKISPEQLLIEFSAPTQRTRSNGSLSPTEFAVLQLPGSDVSARIHRLDPHTRQRLLERITEVIVIWLTQPDRLKVSPELNKMFRSSSRKEIVARVPSPYRKLGVFRQFLKEASSQKQSRQSDNEFDAYLRGLVSTLKQDHALAVKHLKRSIDLRKPLPPRFKAYDMLGFNLQELRRIEDAVKAYKYALYINDDLPSPQHNLGLLYARQKRYELACSYFRRATQLQPDFASAYANLGVAQYNLGQSDKAIAAFDRSIDLGYRKAFVFVGRAAAYTAKGDYQRAYADLETALSIDPRHEVARENLQRLERKLMKAENS